MAEPKFIRDNGCKEAVCVDAGRVYDSCCEQHPTSAKNAAISKQFPTKNSPATRFFALYR
jgi:hypothetical protein